MSLKIDFVLKKSHELHALSDKNTLFDRLMKVDHQCLSKLEKQWSPKDTVQPVVLLRYIIVQELLKQNTINNNSITEIKGAIESRDISKYYKTSLEYQNNLESYKNSDKGMFPQWKEPFSILYPFFYSQDDKQETLEVLESLGNEIINKYDLENARVHCVGFDGSQNYGSSDAWGAVIPFAAGNVQKAHQIFFKINDKGVTGGLYAGHQIDSFIKNDGTQFNNWQEYLDYAGTLVVEWKEKNEVIDFKFQNDEIEFEKKIKKSGMDDLGIFFNVIDNVTYELELENNEKLVFSCGSGQLSFQVGKRYCVCLKKNKFSFITSKNYIIQNTEVGSFTEPDDALFYKNVSGSNVILHLKEIMSAVRSEIMRDNHTHEKKYDNEAFRKAVFDKVYRKKFLPLFYKSNSIVLKNPNMLIQKTLNQILFGPPGTGKTYHTINEAIHIIDPEFYLANNTDRESLRDYYKEKLIVDWETAKGQIGFCTFHQSFSYEDFVEGIKPQKPTDADTYLKYSVQEGIFKRMCMLAAQNIKALTAQKKELISLTDNEFQQSQFYKLSLGDYAEQETKILYDYWKENHVISIGFGDGIDFTGKNETEVTAIYQEKYKDDFGANAINLFKNYLKTGNYVIISKGNQHIRAIGKVTGEYYYDPTTEMRHKHFRKVDWIFKDQEIPVEDLYSKNLSQQTIYKMKSEWIQKSFFVNSGTEVYYEGHGEPQNYVLIVDEINRGNVASIFGELITLIERDKRAGNKEATEVILPYSKERFSVPSNLYIIGTMNTADRSIEALDTALRRRFSFKEMAPDPELIKNEGSLKGSNGMIENIDVVALLNAINHRIEKLIDKDHKIGHAYFMDIETIEDLEMVFTDKVIPLLEEYFFGDYGKIGLVLGDSFVEKSSHDKFAFASFNAYDGQMQQDLKERAIYIIKPSDSWNFVSVYTQTSS